MKNLLIIFGILWLGAGCSPYRILRNETDRTASWSSYKTFAFIDTNRITPVPSTAYLASIEPVKRAIAAELVNRGYEQIAPGQFGSQADLLVNIGGVVNEKTQTRQTTIYEAPRYIGQRRYHWHSQEVPTGTYKEGTISVHLVDARRNEMLWDAAVSSVLKKGVVTDEQVHEGVARLFTKFPGNRN